MSNGKGYVEFGPGDDWWQDDSTTTLLRAAQKLPPPKRSQPLPDGYEVPDDTPSLDTSFHDHEMDVDDE